MLDKSRLAAVLSFVSAGFLAIPGTAFALSLEELSRTYTIPGARGNNAVQTLDAGQLEELRDILKA